MSAFEKMPSGAYRAAVGPVTIFVRADHSYTVVCRGDARFASFDHEGKARTQRAAMMEAAAKAAEIVGGWAYDLDAMIMELQR